MFRVCVQCLRKDAESRRRELHIRTYAVIPLNEECGIIEWVNNTAGLRHILNKLYKERGACAHTKRQQWTANVMCGIHLVFLLSVQVLVYRIKS